MGNIYHRLSDGRVQFEEAFSNDIQAVMEISLLELSLKHHEKTMTALSNNVADATSIISDAASESATIAGQVNEQHEELTNTIISASEETDNVHKEIESQINVNLNNCTVREKEFILKLIKDIGAFITEIKTEI